MVRNGDTLQSIARSVWGDSAMWYLIADANGLASGSTLTAGQVLTIPNKVANIHNNAGTFRPYNPGEAIGDTSPTLPVAPSPPKKKKKCGGFLAIIVAVVAVVATIYTAGAASVALGGATVGSTFGAGVAALTGASGLAAGTAFGIGLAAGAVGSLAGQVFGLATGIQDKFNWGAVAAGAIGAGLGASGAFSIGSGVPGQIASAVAGNIVNQGVGIITGAQKGFSWAGVAAAAIAAPITSKIGKGINNSGIGGTDPAGFALRGALTGIATSTVNELTRVALVGGQVNWSSVAIGGISGGIYGYGEGVNNQARVNAANQRSTQSSLDAGKKLFTWNPASPSANSGFTGESYNVASTGGGVAMSKKNSSEELPVMDGVESLFLKGASGLISTLATAVAGGGGEKLTYDEMKQWKLNNPNYSFGDSGPSLSYQFDIASGSMTRVVGSGESLSESLKNTLSLGFRPVGLGLGDFFGGMSVANNADYPLSIRSQAAFDAGSNSLAVPGALVMVASGVKFSTRPNVGFDSTNLQSKLADYLLNPAHPQNQNKAVWFDKALGLNQSNWENLVIN